MRIVLILSVFFTLSCQAFEADVSRLENQPPESGKDKLRISVNKYLHKYSNEKEIKKFNSKIKDAMEEGEKYGGISTEQAVVDKKLIDWYTDHKHEFNEQIFNQKTLVEGCMFLKYIFDNKLALPKDFQDEVDDKDIDKLSAILDKEIEKTVALKENK